MKTFLKYLLRILALAFILVVLVPAISSRAEAAHVPPTGTLPASTVDAELDILKSELKIYSCPEEAERIIAAAYRNGRMVMCRVLPARSLTITLSKLAIFDYDTLKLLCLDENNTPITYPKQLFPSNHSHTTVTVPGVEPSCAGPGLSEGSYCSSCGEVFTAQVTLEALPHREEALVISKGRAPTCTEDGLSDSVYCSDCDRVITPAVPIEASGHPADEIVVREEAVPASCTESGLTETLYCAACDTVFQTQEYIAPLGHDPYTVEGYAPTCSDWGKSDSEKCSRCEITLKNAEYTQPVRHTWYKEETKDGYIHRWCECGYTAKDSLSAASLDYDISWNPIIGYICTITGMGSCTDSNLVIPELIEGYPVKIIGEYAFFQEKGLKSVTFSSQVNKVMDMAFAQCSSLEWANMPNALSLASGAFNSCEKLNYVYMPWLTSIADGVFSRCFSLTYIELPDSLESIGTQAFANCGLNQIVIPYGVKKIAPNAFELLDNMVIYCEIDSKPFGWSEGWDFGNYDGTMCTVYWNYREEGDERPIHNFCDWYEAQPETETTGRVMERYCYDCWEFETYAFEKKKVYYGTSTNPWLVDGEGLQSKYIERKDEPFTVYADKGEYIYYYSPTEWGKCTFHWGGWVLDIPLFGTFRVDGEEYYVYCFTNTGLGDITAFCT